MPGPWEKYQSSNATAKPWERYAAPNLSATTPPADDYSDAEAFRIAAGKGFADVGIGLTQRSVDAMTGEGIVGKLAGNIPGIGGLQHLLGYLPAAAKSGLLDQKDKLTQEHIEDVARFQQLVKAHPKSTMAGEIGAKAIATLPLGGSAAVGASLPVRIGYGAASGGAGAVVDFAKDDRELAKNISMGAGFGGAVTGALSMIGKTINGWKGRIDENSAAAKKLAEMIKAGFRDESVGYADIMEGGAGKLARHGDQAMQYIPVVGTNAKAERQIADATGILTSLKSSIASGMTIDPDVAIKQAVSVAYRSAKDQSAKNFDELQKMVPDIPVNAGNLQRAAMGNLKELERIGPWASSSDQSLIDVLKKYATPAALNFDELRYGVREALSADIGKAADPHAKAIFTGLKNAVEKDIDNLFDDLGTKAPQVKAAYANAKAFHRENVVPFSQGTLAQVIRGGEGALDNVVDDLAKVGKGREFSRAYKLADDDGKRALQLALIEKGLKTSEITHQGQIMYRPGAFAATMNRLRKSTNALDDNAAKEIQGAINLMSRLDHLDKLMGADKATGATVAKYGPAVAAMGSVGAAAGVGQSLGASAMFRFLFASKKGRNILLAASDQKPNSKSLQLLFESAYQLSTQAGAQLERGEPIDE